MELIDIKKIGEKKILKFKKLGINNVNDLITYYPYRFDIIRRSDMSNIASGDKVIIDGIVESIPTINSTSNNIKKVSFRFTDNKNIYQVLVFNQEYLCSNLHYGTKITIIGKYEQNNNRIIASEIRLGLLPNKTIIEPIYYTTSGLSRKVIASTIKEVLNTNIEVIDYIPSKIKDKYHFKDKLSSLKEIHNPTSTINYKYAKQRLKYEELFLYLLKINYLHKLREKDTKSLNRNINKQEVKDFISTLPFKLTKDQLTTIEEIENDLTTKKRMNRLVQGDVGSGKTIVAFIAMYINYLSGYQTALMVPTEILARQHFNNALSLFKNYDIKIALLTSNTKRNEKNRVYQEIAEGKIDFVIGTQSLIQENLVFASLGLIITDEQHRFGVNQRNTLKNKGIVPDILSMSATPIPRTFALTLYGDMDVSNIRTKPEGRKDIITIFKREKEITEVLYLMKKELDLHHQIYVIAPMVLDDEKNSFNNVTLLKEKMELAFGKVAKVGMVHGKMNTEDKNKIMDKFEKGSLPILISTTVIEVGVNVPNASMIVIFNANLFGLSTLHQLRGRVGRGDIQSYCILVAKEPVDRLTFLTKNNDGFDISEYDFKTRGEGDLFGVRQSGEAILKLANVKRDFDMLVKVKDDVVEFLDSYKKNEFIELDNYLEGLDLVD